MRGGGGGGGGPRGARLGHDHVHGHEVLGVVAVAVVGRGRVPPPEARLLQARHLGPDAEGHGGVERRRLNTHDLQSREWSDSGQTPSATLDQRPQGHGGVERSRLDAHDLRRERQSDGASRAPAVPEHPELQLYQSMRPSSV